MTVNGWLQIAIYVAVLTALVPLLGGYMARVYQGERVLLERPLGWLERLIYRLLGPPRADRAGLEGYGKTTIVFSFVFFLFLYVILRTQSIHPFNPEGFNSAPWDVTFNTTSSFITNTNWQYYGGETTMSYFSQMAGLAVQNFVSAAVGMAVLAAVIRGFASRGVKELGNFWRDVTRTLLYILLPLAIDRDPDPGLAGRDPVLSRLRQLHRPGRPRADPRDGPRRLADRDQAARHQRRRLLQRQQRDAVREPDPVLELRRGDLHPADPRRGHRAVRPHGGQPPPGLGPLRDDAGLHGRPLRRRLRRRAATAPRPSTSPAIETATADGTTGGNLEGKEQRNGIADSAAWANVTTDASNGSVNSAHDSYTGIGGLVPLTNMMTGEVIFGGVGSGLYGMLLTVLLAVFIAGLMVGRTPEYLGKKVEAREMKLVLIGLLFTPMVALIATGIAISSKYGTPSIFNPGPQGFSETLYAYTSQANNNGSAFAGYTGFVQPNAPGNAGSYGITFADILGGLSMLTARFVPLLSALAVAGSLSMKRIVPAGPGTFRTDNPTFVILLISVIVIVAALTFFPALLLGPVVQGLTDQLVLR